MSTFSGLTNSERDTIKTLFRRKTAQPVLLRDRQQIRSSVAHLRDAFPDDCTDIRVMPVSTLEWSSSSFSIGKKRLALVDVEQANAVSFLLAKSLLLERPIFSYTEFMIRASEAYYSAGNSGTALLISKKANERLRAYARSQKLIPNIPRPMAPDDDIFKALTSNIVLSFVTGHEVGHLMTKSDGHLSAIQSWVAETYEKNSLESGKFNDAKHLRFQKPECVQKFDKEGKFSGDIILGIKFAERWDYMKSLQIGESHSDIIGLVALTIAAMEEDIAPDIAGSMVIDLLEFSEMLMSLKRLLPRMPVRGGTTNVSYEATSLGFRRFMFVESLQAMSKRELPVPEAVSTYWDGITAEMRLRLELAHDSGELYSVSNRTVHIARAALMVSSSGHLPEAPTEEMIKKQYGPLAGNGFFLASCLKIPERWLRINRHNNWEPKPENETVPVGFGSAICDIANIVKKKGNTLAAEAVLAKQNGLDHQAMLELIRHPRSQIFQRRLVGRWPNKVMNRL